MTDAKTTGQKVLGNSLRVSLTHHKGERALLGGGGGWPPPVPVTEPSFPTQDRLCLLRSRAGRHTPPWWCPSARRLYLNLAKESEKLQILGCASRQPDSSKTVIKTKK